MLQGFKQFILRGNVLDLAVAVVMGVAFGAVVTALVKDIITPFIAAIVGNPDFSAIEFTINGSKFPIGDFINAVISFILIAAAVYYRRGAHRRCCGLELDPAYVDTIVRRWQGADRRERPSEPLPGRLAIWANHRG